jgi:hypothetical protein
MNAFDAALLSRLAGGTALTSQLAHVVNGGTAPAIFHGQAPEGQPLPYVCYSWQGGGDENQSAHRTKNGLEFVRAYASTATQAGSIDASIDALLHGVPLTVTGWADLKLNRETDLETVENPPNGTQVYMSGGFYRVLLERS